MVVSRACFERSPRLVGPAVAVLILLHCAVRGAVPDRDVQLQQMISLFYAIDSDADGQLNVTELRTQLNKKIRIERLHKRKRAHGASHKEFAEALARCGAACPDGKLALDHVRDVHHVQEHAKARAHAHHYARVAGGMWKPRTVYGGAQDTKSDSASVAGAAATRAGHHRHHARRDAHEAGVHDRFQFADKDGDGRIDKEEFFVLTRPDEAEHERYTAHQVEHHMQVHDIDGDGKMSFDEHFAPHHNHAHARPGAGSAQHRKLLPDLRRRESIHFKQYDLNKDGKLDKEELTRYLFPVHFQHGIVRRKLLHVLRVADSNSDKAVTLREAMPQSRTLLSLLQPRDIAPAVRDRDEL